VQNGKKEKEKRLQSRKRIDSKNMQHTKLHIWKDCHLLFAMNFDNEMTKVTHRNFGKITVFKRNPRKREKACEGGIFMQQKLGHFCAAKTMIAGGDKSDNVQERSYKNYPVSLGKSATTKKKGFVS
jgi:hypothetical protein